jgi:hypothetical protein
MYVLPLILLDPVAVPAVEPAVVLVEPEVPAVLLIDGLVLIFAFVSSNCALELLAVPEVAVELLPDVPVAPVLEPARWRQPVTVTVLALLVLDCDEDVCALTPPVNASAAAAIPLIQTLRFI